MLAEKELGEIEPHQDMALTIGVFDGVHLGHRHLISRLKEVSRERKFLTGVITFRRHPVELLNPSAALPYLTSLEEKLKLIKAEGVDVAVALTFDRELAALSAEGFVRLLQAKLRMRALVVGPDFALGRDREGNVDRLKDIGRGLGFTVTVVPPLLLDGEVVSSTAIRQALANGDMTRVARLMGRPYLIKGIVIEGTGTGRTIGFPTANLKVEAGWAIPADGVYATLTHFDGEVRQSLTSIGLRPTFGGKYRTVETYIVDFQGDLYGKEVAVDVVARLRPERKFASPEELKAQILRDMDQARVILNSATLRRLGDGVK